VSTNNDTTPEALGGVRLPKAGGENMKTCPRCMRGVNPRWNYCPICGQKLRDKESEDR